MWLTLSIEFLHRLQPKHPEERHRSSRTPLLTANCFEIDLDVDVTFCSIICRCDNNYQFLRNIPSAKNTPDTFPVHAIGGHSEVDEEKVELGYKLHTQFHNGLEDVYVVEDEEQIRLQLSHSKQCFI